MQLTLQDQSELVARFSSLRSLDHVAELLEISRKNLIAYLYYSNEKQRYVQFEIPKKHGGIRTISSPNNSLKILQQKLVLVLEQVYSPKPSVHGFVKTRNIVSNAESHMIRKLKYVLNADLKDFFPSINFGRVRGLFMSQPYGLPENIATVLAQICCFQNELPQGAPTSPIISNMICAKMDSQLQSLAKENRCHYTRYADDLTFSTSLTNFPHDLARVIEVGLGEQIVPGEKLHRIIKENGFSLNLEKFRLQESRRRQEITGLVVNKFPNVPREFVREIRAMIHAWQKFGIEAAQAEFLRKRWKHAHESKSPPDFKEVLRGKISYLGSVRGKQDNLYLKYLRQFKQLAEPNFQEPIILQPNLHIFVSYARANDVEVRPITERLSNLGANLWMDVNSINFGENFDDRIEAGLNSCGLMLLFLSEEALNSLAVRREWQYFESVNKPILPIRIKQFPNHSIWSMRQYCDFHNVEFENAFSSLLRDLSRRNVVLNPPTN